MTIVSEDDVARIVPWLDRLLKSPEGGGKVAAALLSSGEASSPARSVLERSTGRSVIGLDRSDADAAPAGGNAPPRA